MFFFSLNPENIILVSTCIFLLYLGQIAQAVGLKYEGATIGAILANSELFFAFLLDATLLAHAVDLFSVAGAAIIFCATVVATQGGPTDTEGYSNLNEVEHHEESKEQETTISEGQAVDAIA